MTREIPFRAAGTFAGPAYIERDADRALREELAAGQRYPYIVAPRQSGKSSLLLRTRRTLDRRTRCAAVDLSLLDMPDYETLWAGVLAAIAESAGLDPQAIQAARPLRTLRAWLDATPERLVVFLDETDAMLRAPFCGQFFSFVRGLFNLRSEEPNFARLIFVLAGAALPSQLISSPATSPFNIGVEIHLDDLSLAETRQLVSHLGSPADGEIAARLHALTGGSVFLSQLLLEKLWASRSTGSVDVAALERLAAEVVAGATAELHFTTMYRAFLGDGRLRTALADLMRDRPIDEQAAQTLRLVGVSNGVAPFRNPLYRGVFDRGGPLDLVRLISGAPVVDEPTASSTRPPAEVFDLVDRLFCGDAARFGAYRRSSEHPADVMIPGILFRFVLSDPEQQRVSLQLYRGLRQIGGALWTREIRALQRASSYQHPALPEILGGAYIEEEDLAFVVTRAARHRLSDPGAMTFIARDRVEALRQFMVLAQGLAILHEQGITHRNLHPGVIEYIEESFEDRKRYSLRLSRFEMSAMINNLVRRRGSGDTLRREELRQIYRELEGSQDALAYCPPERATWLFGDALISPECERSDVFALGVLGWRWLVERAEDGPWPGIGGLDDLRRLHTALRDKLRTRGDLPTPLAKLLTGMLAPEPRDRPSIFDVLDALSRGYARFAASLEPTGDEPTFFVGFMPVEHKKTTFRWGWVDEDPCEPSGRETLRAFLEHELRSAELLYCPDGSAGFLRGGGSREREAMRSARYVLVGRSGYWFCDIYHEPGTAYDQSARRVEQLLLIKYVIRRGSGRRLDENHLRRTIPGEIVFVPVWPGQSIDLHAIRGVGRSWSPLLESVRHEQSTPAWMTTMESALEFLQALRRAEYDARVFPYEVVGGDARATVDVAVDSDRNRGYQFADPLRSLYFRTMRAPMGRLLEEHDGGERSTMVEVFADRDGRPNFTDGSVEDLLFDRRLDDETVRLRGKTGGRGLPQRGWLRPKDDAGSHAQLRRQEQAVRELLAARSLMHQLHHPLTIKGLRTRWEHAGKQLGEHRNRQIVQDMLRCEPFYALHGPPGTGKTTVAATAVVEHLKLEPGHRVLISSQSHNALDNLALRILALDPELVAVRIMSDHAVADGKPHPDMQRRRPDQLANDAVARIVRECERRLASPSPEDDRLRPLLREWMEVVPRVLLELCDRIRRGASLVFATTGTCTTREVGAAGAGGMYDWVIVEEAARAWPAELALPLVRGLRWALIGDHFQLPAFDDLTVYKFLDLCERSDDDELRAHGERKDEYGRVFRMFASLFDQRASRRRGRPAGVHLTEPLDELDEQFRMHPDICRVVSRAFYRQRVDRQTGEVKQHPDGWLKTAASAKRTHGRAEPRFLRGRAAVWLDTAGVPNSADQRAWKNPGEAEVIRRLLAELEPEPAAGDDGFALLTPYNEQNDLLRSIDLPAWASSRIDTTDGFQGREADIVVVSLVRSVQRSPDRPEANIGHLVSPNRVNVLLSRARTLLVVVGRFEHFVQQPRCAPDRADIAFWRSVTDTFREQDGVIDAATVLGRGGAW